MDDNNTDFTIDIDIIPTDAIEPGVGPDGLPITVPGARNGGAAPVAAPVKTGPTLAELQEAQRQRDIAAERAARAEAEVRTRATSEAEMRAIAEEQRQRADRASQDVYASQGHAWQTYLQNVTTQKSAITGQIQATRALQDAAERELAAASEAGDHRRIAAANRDLSSAAAERAQLEARIPQVDAAINEADYYVRQIAAAGPPPASKPVPEPVQPDPASPQASPEQWIDTVGNTVNADVADWLREHRDYVTDPAKHETLMSFAKFYAQKHGQAGLRSAKFTSALKAEFSPESEVEEAETVTEEPTPPAAATVTEPRRSAPPAAPVSRASTPGRPSSSEGKIQLTQEQYNIAPSVITSVDDLDPDLKARFGGVWTETAARAQYYRNSKRAEKDGKLGRAR